MCVWPEQSDCKSTKQNRKKKREFFHKHSSCRQYTGPVKNFTPQPTNSPSIAPFVPWIPRRTTYPSSYILTDTSSVLSSSDTYKSIVICPPNRSWRVPDPYDCAIYHDCYHGTDLVSYCPSSLQYNHRKQRCDDARNVRCTNYVFI